MATFTVHDAKVDEKTRVRTRSVLSSMLSSPVKDNRFIMKSIDPSSTGGHGYTIDTRKMKSVVSRKIPAKYNPIGTKSVGIRQYPTFGRTRNSKDGPDNSDLKERTSTNNTLRPFGTSNEYLST